MSVLAPRSRTLEDYATPFPVRRFPFMPARSMELLAERTMKDAPLHHLAQLPPYMVSAYLHLVAGRVDVVHAHLAIPLGFMASLNPGHAPLVVTCHGSDCTLPLTRPLYRPFTRHVLRRAERVVAVSHYIEDLAIRLGAPPEKTEVIYLGVDTSKFKPSGDKAALRTEIGIPEDTLLVGTLGRLVPEKRVEDTMAAVAMVSKELDVHLLVGGDGPDRGRLETLASRLGMDNVTFLGRVADAVRFHRLCDVFVLSSVSEGLSVSLQEAMASGCVPVAVNGFGCPELVRDGENGYLFEPRNVEDLAHKLLLAAEDPSPGSNARATILQRFDVDVNAARYVELYDDVTSTP